MLGNGLVGVLVASTAATGLLGPLGAMSMTTASALTTGVPGGVEGGSLGDGVLAGLVNGVGNLTEGDLLGRVNRHGAGL
ncbi:MAG: hypothetical protein E7H95_19325, partial [Clostridium sp.]